MDLEPPNNMRAQQQGGHDLKERTRHVSPTYVAEVMEILQSIRQGSHLGLTENDSLEDTAREWCEIYFGVIPEDRLRECYIAAERNPNRRQEDKTFPLRRREILDAWYRIEAAQPKNEFTCNYCELYFAEPAKYEPCPFHKTLRQLVSK
jgi:hypothetical protein